MITVPRVLPTWVSQVSMYVEETEPAASAIPLPPAWTVATAERQRDYRAGRYCAQLALEQIGVSKYVCGICDTGGPAWPAGVVGSITHALGFVSAAAAPRWRCAGIGLDAEPIGSLDKAHSLAGRVATSNEVFAVMDSAKTDYASAVTLIVSAKHCLYKCLHPQLGGRSFSYLDAAIDEAKLGSNQFRARLKVTLSPQWPGGTLVTGQIDMLGDFIYTGIAIAC